MQTLYAGANPRYFGLRCKGATWLHVVNDQVMGLGGVVVPQSPLNRQNGHVTEPEPRSLRYRRFPFGHSPRALTAAPPP
ncbi:hypothetical protein ACFXPQ_22675 [Streptomyces lydicus]|uniref:hypothetical protein n=1 Tax=Streptomyces lydicus TaxID=47763 RepID=UPI0036B767C2